MDCHCIFCGKPIEPEPSIIKDSRGMNVKGYTFQCDNEYCEAIYSSQYMTIHIDIYRSSTNPDINWLRNE
jgi:hypothetical protein